MTENLAIATVVLLALLLGVSVVALAFAGICVAHGAEKLKLLRQIVANTSQNATLNHQKSRRFARRGQ